MVKGLARKLHNHIIRVAHHPHFHRAHHTADLMMVVFYALDAESAVVRAAVGSIVFVFLSVQFMGASAND